MTFAQTLWVPALNNVGVKGKLLVSANRILEVCDMASKRKRGGKFQYVFKNAGLFPRPAYKSFDDEVEGDLYAARMDALLSQGIVSDELVSGKPEPGTVKDLLRRYQQEAQVGDSDYPLLRSLIEQVGSTQLQGLTSNWARRIFTNNIP